MYPPVLVLPWIIGDEESFGFDPASPWTQSEDLALLKDSASLIYELALQGSSRTERTPLWPRPPHSISLGNLPDANQLTTSVKASLQTSPFWADGKIPVVSMATVDCIRPDASPRLGIATLLFHTSCVTVATYTKGHGTFWYGSRRGSVGFSSMVRMRRDNACISLDSTCWVKDCTSGD